jgi:hypothetical protein
MFSASHTEEFWPHSRIVDVCVMFYCREVAFICSLDTLLHVTPIGLSSNGERPWVSFLRQRICFNTTLLVLIFSIFEEKKI